MGDVKTELLNAPIVRSGDSTFSESPFAHIVSRFGIGLCKATIVIYLITKTFPNLAYLLHLVLDVTKHRNQLRNR